MARRVFVSYARSDQRIVRSLVDGLRTAGLDVALDEGTRAGDEWWPSILDAIARSDVFLLVLSDASVRSEFCSSERGFAAACQREMLAVDVADRVDLPGPDDWLESRQWVRYREGEPNSLARIVGELYQIASPGPSPPDVPRPPRPGGELAALASDVRTVSTLDARAQTDLAALLVEYYDREELRPEERSRIVLLAVEFTNRADVRADVRNDVYGRIVVPAGEVFPEEIREGLALKLGMVEVSRVLRLSIVFAVVSLGFAAVSWRGSSGCWPTSLGAYRATPVQSLYVGTFVAIAVVMFVLRTSGVVGATLHRLTAISALVAAFVPTRAPSGCFDSVIPTESVASESVVVGVLLLAWTSSVIVTVALWRDARSRSPAAFDLQSVVVTAYLTVPLAWALVAWDSFAERAHGVAMVTFALCVISVILDAARRVPLRAVYSVLAACIIVSVVGAVFIVPVVAREWDHAILWIEVAVLVGLAVFAVLQSVEFWDVGVATQIATATPEE